MLRCRLFAVALLSLVALRGRAGKGSGLADNVGVGRKNSLGRRRAPGNHVLLGPFFGRGNCVGFGVEGQVWGSGGERESWGETGNDCVSL